VTISSIMQTGLSALTANQQALKATSTNVANVNTVGYSRLDVQFRSASSAGGTGGVSVDVNRIANAYLAAAEMRGAADVSAADQLSQFMDRAQGLLGDPSASGTVFATLDPVFSAFGALSVDPASALRRSESLSDLQTLLSQLGTTHNELSALRDEANSKLQSTMDEANSLMQGIAKLNQAIQKAQVGGQSSSEAQTEQSRMLDRLSEIVDVRVQQRPLGGIEVRTTDGLLLADLDAGRLALATSGPGGPYPAAAIIAPRTTNEIPIESHLQGGELKGLLRARDRELPDLMQAFGEFAGGAADAINAAHNAGTAMPPPSQITGRNTGLIATDRLNFSGATNIGFLNADGQVLNNYRIDFSTGTITDEGGAVTNFANSVGDLTTALNTAFGANGTASFAGGSLQIATSVNGPGIAITDDPTTPALRSGKGFSHTFGLNDLVSKSSPFNFSTGLSGADLHGFTAGDTVRFAMRNTDGSILQTVDFTVGSGTTIASLRSDLDAALNGYAQTTFDANGKLSFNITNKDVGSVDVLRDTTLRGDTGISMSGLFGLGEEIPAARATGLQIRSAISADPNLIAAGQADLAGAAVGTRVLTQGDGRGALKLEAAGSTSRSFAQAGSLTAQTTSVNDYAARLAGFAGGRAQALDGAKAAAASVRDEVKTRRQSEEGVNIDEELVKMTTYQQAYSAASRMITAAKDLYDILLNMV
jgi:flagellar hook-associated protein 1 FlgK